MANLSITQIAAISRTVEEWNIDESIKRASEELLELALSLLHYGRNKADTNDVLDEMADVHIVLKHLELKFGDYQFQLNNKVTKGNK